ncbi:unnamed protein product [Phyllotreta striolata]|uniref:Uncharacterized protein n=1 Tax=Phyllotreta striolata TaxID=444603 RepID=A0A9N9TNX1_PHYSR|nr:unnamed protein product [Phyllotreta striolata]
MFFEYIFFYFRQDFGLGFLEEFCVRVVLRVC